MQIDGQQSDDFDVSLHLLSPLEEFSEMFHAVNLIDNLYNCVKFNPGVPYPDPLSPARSLDLHLPAGPRGKAGVTITPLPKHDRLIIEHALFSCVFSI